MYFESVKGSSTQSSKRVSRYGWSNRNLSPASYSLITENSVGCDRRPSVVSRRIPIENNLGVRACCGIVSNANLVRFYLNNSTDGIFLTVTFPSINITSFNSGYYQIALDLGSQRDHIVHFDNALSDSGVLAITVRFILNV
jgi:hypothetical protein